MAARRSTAVVRPARTGETSVRERPTAAIKLPKCSARCTRRAATSVTAAGETARAPRRPVGVSRKTR
eukprot:3527745-Alexandrium_andersonii.AAC.1